MNNTAAAETHICLTCEEAGRAAVVVLNQHGRCPVCNGDSVVCESVLIAYAKAQAALKSKPTGLSEAARETSTQQLAENDAKRKAQIEFVAKGVRAFLIRNHLHDLNNWWTGQRYWLEWSFFDESHPADSCEYVDLILGNANDERRLRMYVDLDDASMHEEIKK